MRSIAVSLAILFLAAVTIQGEPSQAPGREAFDRRMFSPVALGTFGTTSPEQFASLDDGQKQALLGCHDVLVALFRRLSKREDFSEYLTTELQKKYRTAADLVAPETELAEVGLLDWDFQGGKTEIQMRFFAAVYSEGNWVLSNNTASFKKSGSAWQIDKLDLNQKEDR
jgi:hypothetical protein